jgi:hypothetical protein
LFFNYLIDNQKFNELQYALTNDTTDLPNDSLAFYRTKLGILSAKNDWIYKNFENCKHLLKKDSTLNQELASYFLSAKDSIRKRWFQEYFEKEKDSVSLVYLKLNASIDYYDSISSNEIPNQLKLHFAKYTRFQHKKPIVSAMLSTLFPGLGKLYNGRKYSFRFIVLTQSIFGLKLVESNYRLGWKHPYTFFTEGIFLLYYGASIVGSYEDCKQVKQEQKQIYIQHVQNYIRTNSAD